MAILVLIILIAPGAFLLSKAHKDAPVVDGGSIYDKPLTNNDSPNKTNPNNTPTQTQEDSNNTNAADPDITGVINFSSIVDNKLTIRVTIGQSLSDGTCLLTLTRASDGKNVTETANIVLNPSSTTCAGFDIPTYELGSGSWAISIKINSDGKSGEITGNVSI